MTAIQLLISSARHAANLLSKWKADHTPVVVAFSIERLASFRFKGFITSVSWPIVRVAEGYSNFVVDFTAARAFEHLEPREANPDMHSLMETAFISLLRAVVPQGEIFFSDLPPKDITNLSDAWKIRGKQ